MIVPFTSFLENMIMITPNPSRFDRLTLPALVLALIGVALTAAPASAATLLKLADIQPGTEVVNTAIVTNGDFEDTTPSHNI